MKLKSIIETKFDEAFPNTILNGFPPRRVVYKEDHEKLRDEIIEAIHKHFT